MFHKNIQKQQSNKMLGICRNVTCQCSSSLNDPIVLFALAYLTTNDASMKCVCSIVTCRRSPAITLLDFGWDSGLVKSIHQPSFSLYRLYNTNQIPDASSCLLWSTNETAIFIMFSLSIQGSSHHYIQHQSGEFLWHTFLWHPITKLTKGLTPAHRPWKTSPKPPRPMPQAGHFSAVENRGRISISYPP